MRGGFHLPAVLTRDHAVYGGLDGKLYVVPLSGGQVTSFATAFGAPITAPVAVADGRIYVACEDGYLYVLGPDGNAPLPEQDLQLWKIRSPLTGPLADAKFDWYTNYGDFSGTNANAQGLKPPLRMRWARRLEGTVKHLPVCGGGRLYTHTAEGQIIAVEQDTGRLLWRRYWPDVYLSFTSPLYVAGKLLVPQAGIKRSRMRCLDAATGKLLWEAPFTGSPSWSRQFPPVVQGNVAIYASGSGEYAAQGTEEPFTFGGTPVDADGREVMSWIYSNDNPYYPKNNRPRLWAWDLETGKVVWEKDFSEYGRGGNDCGICLLDGKLYYSTFFGYAASQRRRRGLPAENNGLTACLEPETGKVVWLTTKYYVTSKCTLSARDGRIYIGGNNRAQEGTDDRFVWCLDASDGSLVWKSDAVTSALNVVTVGEQFIFSNALRGRGNVFDQQTGKVVEQHRPQLRLLPVHALRAVRAGREHGHDRPLGQRQAGLDRTGDRFARVPGSGRLERPHLLHVSGQRLCRVANVWRDLSVSACCVGETLSSLLTIRDFRPGIGPQYLTLTCVVT